MKAKQMLFRSRKTTVLTDKGHPAKQMPRPALLMALPSCLLLLFLPMSSFAQAKEVLKFEPRDTIEVLRAKIEHNGYQFKVDHNWVYDMPAEKKAAFLGLHQPLVPAPRLGSTDDYRPLSHKSPKGLLPTQFCWTNYNGHSYIGPIRHQGDCGSCYAFGACAAAEGTYNVAMGLYDANCIDFSESYIIWCLGRLSRYSGHFFGCNGGDLDNYHLQALTVEGVTDEAHFPYTATDPGSCTHWVIRPGVLPPGTGFPAATSRR